MSKSSEIRARARARLGGNIFAAPWLFALLASLVVALVTGLISKIPFLGTVAGVIVAGAVYIGVAVYYLKLTRGENVGITDLLHGFKNDFSGNFMLGFMRSVFITLWSLLFVIPGIIKTYSYSMAVYIKADHPYYRWNECITISRYMMKGYKWKFFCLQLSFIGWDIVNFFMFGIGNLWLIPYKEAAYAEFYKERKAEYYEEY